MGTVYRIFAVVVLAAAPVVVAGAATIPASDSRIVEVTVFADRAEVVREAKVQLTAGASSVEFTGLPFEIEADSLRVSATGVPAILGTVELRQLAETPVETPELVAAQEEVRRLEWERAQLDGQEHVAGELSSFLESIKAASAKHEGENLAAGKADPASLQGVYALLRTSFEDLSRQGLERGKVRQKLDRELEVARARLAALRPAASIRSRAVRVEVETRTAGSLAVRLTYLVGGAGWRPSYRASLDAAKNEVDLVSEGVVRQRTGEDWTEVALHLSTAAPARGVEPPKVASLLLRARAGFGDTEGYVRDRPVAGREYQNIVTPAPGVAEEVAVAPPPQPAVTETASVVQTAYHVSFEVPGRASVPADGTDHRVVLRQENLAGKQVYRCAPALNPAAFLTAITTAPRDYPLLAGPVRVFAGGAYLGAYGLGETAPGSELTLPFGIDNRLKVERVRLPEDRSLEGVSGKTRQIGYAFKTTLENLRDDRVTLTLEDRVPVSEDERIVVTMGKETTAGHKDSENRPGVLLWALELAPHEKRDVLLSYTVRHPRELFVPGVE